VRACFAGENLATTANKQMNIEQGMSKEEGGNRHEKAQEGTRSLV
jgi:hypothetical protein